jgi:hypothetical protein
MGEILAVSRIGQARSVRRAIAASALAKLRKGSAQRVLRAAWPRDEGALQILVQRSAVSPTSTGDYPHHDVIGSFFSLVPASAALNLFDRANKLDLAGLTTISVPSMAGQLPRPVFVAEGAPAPSISPGTASTVLGPARKILVLAAITTELDEASPELASELIGRILADASTTSIDIAAFDSNPASAIRPAGLLSGVTPITPTAASGNDVIPAMTADLANLVGAIADAGVDPTDAVFVAGAREAMAIKLRAGPRFDNAVLMTQGLAPKSVACFAPAGVFSSFSGLPEIDVGSESTIHAEDTSPLPLVGGSPVTVAAPQRSLFQTFSLAIRVRTWAAWAVAKGAASVVNSVTW